MSDNDNIERRTKDHNSAIVSKKLASVYTRAGLGDPKSKYSNALYGINLNGSALALPENKDNQGLNFFTRPRFNLTYDNAKVSRILLPFVTGGETTLQRALRVLLDPVSENGGSNELHFRGGFPLAGGGGKYSKSIIVPQVKSPLVDRKSPFIPLLSNLLVSLTGWPDETMDTYTSEAGVGRETFSISDSYTRNYGEFDLTATFRNPEGDPVTALIRMMMEYMNRVHDGSMSPWPDSLMETEIDYQTRIFRIILDSSKTKVQKIGSATAGFPLGNPLGAAFNYNKDKPYNEENSQVTVPFRCVGAEYNDPILITEFNDISFMFNPELERSVQNKGISNNMPYLKVSAADKGIFNYRAYPVIDEETWEMQWWVSREVYEYVRAQYFTAN